MEWRCIQCQKKPGKKIAVKLTKNPKQKIFHHTCKKSPKGFYTAEKDDTPYLAIGKACVYQALSLIHI